MKNEVNFGLKLNLSLTVALFWRWFLIGIPLGFGVQKFLVLPPALELLVQFAVSFICLFIAVQWLFGEGRFSSLKIIVMEQADYQKLSGD